MEQNTAFQRITSRLGIYVLMSIIYIGRQLFGLLSPLYNSFFLHGNPKPHINRHEPEYRLQANYKPFPPLPLVPKVEALWDISGLYMIYQLGIAQYIYKECNKDFLRSQCVLTGISGGCGAAGFLTMSLCGIGDPAYWYHHHVRRVVDACSVSSSGLVLNTSDEIWNIAFESFKLCHHLGVSSTDLTDRFRVIVSEINRMWVNMKVIKHFPTSAYFADAMTASALVPFITMRRFSIKVGDHHCMDGGLTYRNHSYPLQTKKRIVFTFVPDLVDPMENVVIVDIRNKEMKNGMQMNRLVGYNTTRSQMDELFAQGYQWGKDNAELLKSLFS